MSKQRQVSLQSFLQKSSHQGNSVAEKNAKQVMKSEVNDQKDEAGEQKLAKNKSIKKQRVIGIKFMPKNSSSDNKSPEKIIEEQKPNQQGEEVNKKPPARKGRPPKNKKRNIQIVALAKEQQKENSEKVIWAQNISQHPQKNKQSDELESQKMNEELHEGSLEPISNAQKSRKKRLSRTRMLAKKGTDEENEQQMKEKAFEHRINYHRIFEEDKVFNTEPLIFDKFKTPKGYFDLINNLKDFENDLHTQSKGDVL